MLFSRKNHIFFSHEELTHNAIFAKIGKLILLNDIN